MIKEIFWKAYESTLQKDVDREEHRLEMDRLNAKLWDSVKSMDLATKQVLQNRLRGYIHSEEYSPYAKCWVGAAYFHIFVSRGGMAKHIKELEYLVSLDPPEKANDILYIFGVRELAKLADSQQKKKIKRLTNKLSNPGQTAKDMVALTDLTLWMDGFRKKAHKDGLRNQLINND